MDQDKWPEWLVENKTPRNTRFSRLIARFSKLPYWLRGGIIGATVTAVFVIAFYLCTLIPSPPGSDLGFMCLYPFIFSPMYPVGLALGEDFPFEYLPIVSIAIWFVVGIILGQIAALINSPKNHK